MLEHQKVFLRFFNQIHCNKGLKAEISWFFSCFFCLTPLRPECSRIRKTPFLRSHRLKKYKNLQAHIYLNSSTRSFSSDIMLPFLNLKQQHVLNLPVIEKLLQQFFYTQYISGIYRVPRKI